MVEALTDVTSTKIRNRVAGYIAHLVKIGSESALPFQNSS